MRVVGGPIEPESGITQREAGLETGRLVGCCRGSTGPRSRQGGHDTARTGLARGTIAVVTGATLGASASLKAAKLNRLKIRSSKLQKINNKHDQHRGRQGTHAA